ncbi:SDR family NAD(P)-dependent oxidoreductase [Reinekea sp.]|uniref:SDR family NAD(P)-dependent oxidoreductase n=1 Tax=Reinekea sp. TaxID=1970455 RepID=UPI003989A7C7
MPSVLITGAAKGLGRELTRSFSNHKWSLLLIVRSTESAADLKSEFPEAKILISDIRSLEHEGNLSKWLGDYSVDVLINNAGSGSKGPSIKTATAEQISKVFETNCVGVFSTVKGAYQSLKKGEKGLVINISSRRGSLSMQAAGAAKGSGCSYSYRISKAAQNMLTLCLADDLE